eukprot:GHRR01001566.1.p1 GENE.GHRR01001566.1~~GHRR01001566.1.p1  ORF type:complete len:264 (+),score=98.15 GHRR01001566.1:1067-1858(+)
MSLTASLAHHGNRTASLSAAAAAGSRLELALQSMSPAVAMVMLHCWLADIRDSVLRQQQLVQQPVQQPQQQPYFTEQVVLNLERNRHRDRVVGFLCDSSIILLASRHNPFKASKIGSSSSSIPSSSLEAAGPKVAGWLSQGCAQMVAMWHVQPIALLTYSLIHTRCMKFLLQQCVHSAANMSIYSAHEQATYCRPLLRDCCASQSTAAAVAWGLQALTCVSAHITARHGNMAVVMVAIPAGPHVAAAITLFSHNTYQQPPSRL